MDDVRLTADLPVKGCREARFSHGGQYFAAATGPYVLVFSTYSMEQIATLKGHSGIVRSLTWRDNDLGLATAGVDGAVYEWEWGVEGLDRLNTADHVLKSAHYEAVVSGPATKAGTPLVAGGRDGMLRELKGGNVGHEVRTDGAKVTQLALSVSDRLLLVGTAAGVVRTYGFPLDAPTCLEMLPVHASPITRLCLSHDESMLFSASEDGQIFMCEMLGEGAGQRERVRRREGEESAASEMDTVLVSQSELLERMGVLEELEQRVKEQTMQAEYQQHLREQRFQDELRTVKESGAVALQEAQECFEAQARLKLAGEREFAEERQATEAAHMKVAEELEHLYERKLATEAARWEALRKEKEDGQCQLEEKIYSLMQSSKSTETKLRQHLDETRMASNGRVAEMEEKVIASDARYESMLKQEDMDNDQELESQRLAAHRAVVHEREEKQTLKGEQAIMRKKFASFQSEMAKLRNSVDEKQHDIKSLQVAAAEREKAIALLKKDVAEREESIADKERRMGELKGKNRELEKFKFVLDYKLRELAREIEPRDEQIMQMRETIRELDDELQRDYKTSVGLEQGLTEKQAKIDSLQEECKKERRLVQEKERVISFFGRDVQKLVNTTDPHALREGVKEIYRTIVRVAEGGGTTKESDTVQAEFANQRAYMEHALESVKIQKARTEAQSAADQKKRVGENEALIRECNRLRQESRELRSALAAMQAEAQGGSTLSNPSLAGRRAPSAGLLTRPTTASSITSMGGSRRPASGKPRPLGAMGGDLQGSRGQLLRGSAGALGRERARAAEMQMSAESHSRELEAQHAEIFRLREQLNSLGASGAEGGAEDSGEGGGGGGGGGGGSERPYSSQDRPSTAVELQPRASSAVPR